MAALLRPLRPLAIAGVAAALVAVAVTTGIAAGVRATTAGSIYAPDEVPAAPVALVLGKLVYPDGTPSPLLRGRLQVALGLYRAGRVRAILASGDGGSRPGYDEVSPMRRWLIAHGVPAGRVVPDPAGFDTYASCARAHDLFGVTRAIVVTSSYHLPRAVALCRSRGIDAVGVGDDSGRADWWSWWSGTAREQPATALALLDMLARSGPPSPTRPSPALTRALASD
jgi:vancomycin permeability regulator SanA